MNETKSRVFSTKYKEGELVLRVNFPSPYDYEMDVGYKTQEKEEDILSFCPELMNTRRFGVESVGVYDSYREETGEVAFQMHGNYSVARPAFPYGIILCLCDDFTEPGNPNKMLQDVSHVESGEFMDALAKLCIEFIRSMLKPTADPRLPLYFVYYGRDHIAYDGSFRDNDSSIDVSYHTEEGAKRYIASVKEITAIGRAVYKGAKGSKKLGLFRCAAGLTTSEICFLALAGELNDQGLVDGNVKLGNRIRSAKEFPRIRK